MGSTFHISICGGGIGGLTLALVIGKYGTHPVEIFEAGSSITNIGAGIGFFERTMEIMKDLGLYDELVKMAAVPPKENLGPIFRKSDQRNGYYWFCSKLKCGQLMVHRKDMMDLLLRRVPTSCIIHTSKKLDSYDVDSTTGKITLHFSDGSNSVTDMLVGADGIRSATRRTMFRILASLIRDGESRQRLLEYIDPVWTGTLVYRSLVPTTKLQKDYPKIELPTSLTMHLGKKKHVIAYPISQGTMINLVIFHHNVDAFGTQFEGHWVMRVSEDEVFNLFEGWDPRVEALVKCVEKPSRWVLHSLRELPHHVDGRVALLGDAAHDMEPHLGAGAGQAIEDAYVLGRLLTHQLTHLGNVAEALKTYEEVRLPFVNSLARRSRDVGLLYSFSPSGSVPFRESQEGLDNARKLLEDAWALHGESEWVWRDAERRWETKCTMHATL